MNQRTKNFLVYSFLVVATIFLAFRGLAMAKGVLAPIFLAVVLAMMLTPVANWLERKGIKRGWSSFFSDLLILLFILGLFWAIGYEIEKLTENWSTIQSRLRPIFEKAETFIENNSAFSVENPFSQDSSQQNNATAGGMEQAGGSSSQETTQSPGEAQGNKENSTSSSSQESGAGISKGGSSIQQMSIKDILTSFLSNLFSSLSTILLILVYIFFMLLYRDKFEKAVLKFVRDDQQERGRIILAEISKDAQQYLFGHVILIIIFIILYSVGFSISGMKSAIPTAILISLISIIPYIGTIFGGLLALSMAFITTGSTSTVLIVLGTLVVAQFIESYFVEPYLIGKRVNINPLFSIISIIVGAAVWGVIGMIVFLPLLSFIKAVADHVPILHPLGYAIGKEDASDGKSTLSKIKDWFK